METITKTDAKNSANKFYFTGKPCKNGGIGPRRVSNDQCCCEICTKKDRERSLKYSKRNKEKVALRKKLWADKNKEHVKQKNRDYYHSNKDVIKSRSKEYRESNKEYVSSFKKEYYSRNKEKIDEKSKERYLSNRKRLESFDLSSITRDEVLSIVSYNPDSGEMVRIDTGKTIGTEISGGYHMIYLTIKGVSHRILAHRLAFLIMTGRLPEYPREEVDHIDHNRSNNSWSNLRIVDAKGNGRNQSLRSTNSSGITGVSWDSQAGKYAVYINHEGRKIHLGYAESLEDAALIRHDANAKYGYHEMHGSAKVMP